MDKPEEDVVTKKGEVVMKKGANNILLLVLEGYVLQVQKLCLGILHVILCKFIFFSAIY